VYRKNEDIVTIGAYQKGSNVALDAAVALNEPLRSFLRQPVDEHVPRAVSFNNLKKIVG
jgi:flagellum-specific ATP synthase